MFQPGEDYELRVGNMRNNFGRPGFRRMRSVSESQSDTRFHGGGRQIPLGRFGLASRVRTLSGSGGALMEEAGMSRANSLGDTRGKNPPRERHASTSKASGPKTNATAAAAAATNKQHSKTKPSVVKTKSGASCSSQAASAGQVPSSSSQSKKVVPVTATSAGTSGQAAS